MRLPSRWYLAFGALAVVAVVTFVIATGLVQRVPGAPSAVPPAAAPPSVAPLVLSITPPPPPTSFLYVSPSGSDSNDGSASRPLQTIQAGLDRVTPGTQITLAPGVYRERLQTTVDGTAAAPIWIKGPETGTDRAGRYKAVPLRASRVFSVDHSHYVFDGFTIDGQEQLADRCVPDRSREHRRLQAPPCNPRSRTAD